MSSKAGTIDTCLECDKEYVLPKDDRGYCESCFERWSVNDKQAHILCRMFNRSGKWYHLWWWRGIDGFFYRLHQARCPEDKQL
jgi:hypothetical protein